MFGLFSYIRAKVREAVVGGVADAVEHVDRLDWSGTADEVRARLLGPALTPAALSPAPDEEENPPTNGTGRRRPVRQ